MCSIGTRMLFRYDVFLYRALVLNAQGNGKVVAAKRGYRIPWIINVGVRRFIVGWHRGEGTVAL